MKLFGIINLVMHEAVKSALCWLLGHVSSLSEAFDELRNMQL